MSFLKLIKKNKIFKKNSKILDIGTGGFCGRNTLIHYINIISNENIYCIELNKLRYNQLLDNYKHTKINIYNDNFFIFDNNIKYDIIICDLDTNIFMNRFNDIINKADSLLSKNGYIIIMVTGNFRYITNLTSNKEDIIEIKQVYKKIWKTNNITNKIIQKRLNKKFKVLDSADHTKFTRYVLIQN